MFFFFPFTFASFFPGSSLMVSESSWFFRASICNLARASSDESPWFSWTSKGELAIISPEPLLTGRSWSMSFTEFFQENHYTEYFIIFDTRKRNNLHAHAPINLILIYIIRRMNALNSTFSFFVKALLSKHSGSFLPWRRWIFVLPILKSFDTRPFANRKIRQQLVIPIDV